MVCGWVMVSVRLGWVEVGKGMGECRVGAGDNTDLKIYLKTLLTKF